MSSWEGWRDRGNVIPKRMRRDVWCMRCDTPGHTEQHCRRRPLEAPLETPGSNGPYQGPRQVEVIPVGIGGSELAAWRQRKDSAA